jgi:hypothetical protein
MSTTLVHDSCTPQLSPLAHKFAYNLSTGDAFDFEGNDGGDL